MPLETLEKASAESKLTKTLACCGTQRETTHCRSIRVLHQYERVETEPERNVSVKKCVRKWKYAKKMGVCGTSNCLQRPGWWKWRQLANSKALCSFEHAYQKSLKVAILSNLHSRNLQRASFVRFKDISKAGTTQWSTSHRPWCGMPEGRAWRILHSNSLR